MNKVKYRRKFLISFLGIIIYLFCANFIVSLVFQEKVMKTIKFEELEITTDYVRAGVDSLIEMGTMLEEISISGWAFSQNEAKEDSNKKIYVVLKNDNNTYISAASDLFVRSDIYDRFGDEVSMAGDNNGFTIDIASYNLKDGLYDVYVYCVENEESKGLFKTKYVLEKKGTQIQAVNTCQISQINDRVEVSNTVLYGFDNVSISNGEVHVKGWAINTESVNDNNEYYLLLKFADKELFISTNSFSRYDVNNLYNIETNEIGFECDIALADILSDIGQIDEIQMNVLIKQEEDYLLAENGQTYEIIDNNLLEKKFVDCSMTQDEFLAKFKDSEITYTPNVRFTIDSVKENSLFTSIYGWGTMFNLDEIKDAEYYLEIEDSGHKKYYWYLERFAREDIASAYGDIHLLSGITTEISKSLLQDGELKIRFHVVKDNFIWSSPDAIILEYSNDQILIP